MERKSLLSALTTLCLSFSLPMMLHAQTYCDVSGTDCSDADEITNFSFVGINHNSSCDPNGYSDFTDSVAYVQAGTSYPVSVTIPPHVGNNYVALWIDFNQDGNFDADEYTFLGTSPSAGSTVTANVSIPVNALSGQTTLRIRTRFNTLLESSDACLVYAYGETEDYLVDVSPAPACSGTPDPGVITASTDTVCPGITFNLMANVIAEDSLSYQWQVSTDGGANWADLGSLHYGATYSLTQSQASDYRVIAVCASSGLSDTSNVVSVSVKSVSECYCEPYLDCTDGDNILGVSIATLNNTGNSCTGTGYTNFSGTVVPVDLKTEIPYGISVTVGDGWDYESVSVWIDHNQDGQFDVSEFTYIGTGSDETLIGTVILPASALPGLTRMRVRVAAIGDTDATGDKACDEDDGYGETQDYDVNIIISVPCAGTPDAGTASASVNLACVGVPVQLNSDGELELGYTYQWQSSPDGITWDNLGTSQNVPSYTVPSQSSTTQYRVIYTCTNSSLSDTSLAVVVAQDSPDNCYCTPSIAYNCTDGDVITNVTFAGINNNSTCSGGYSDYSAVLPPGEVMAGASATMSVTVGPSGDGWLYESVGVWIDFNHNGILDSLEGEYTYLGTGLNEAVTGVINIPSTASIGITRLRVVVAASVNMYNEYVCGPVSSSNPYGEMEDYALRIIPYAFDSIVVNTVGNVPAAISTPGGTLPLEATIYPATQNQDVIWSVVNVTGQASISATGVVTAEANGTVWAKATSVADVSQSDSILVTITLQDLSLDDVYASMDLNVFPNPTSDVVTLKSTQEHGRLSLQVLDITGKVLVTRAIQQQELQGGVTLDMTTFASGMYYIRLSGEDSHVTRSVIKN